MNICLTLNDDIRTLTILFDLGNKKSSSLSFTDMNEQYPISIVDDRVVLNSVFMGGDDMHASLPVAAYLSPRIAYQNNFVYDSSNVQISPFAINVYPVISVQSVPVASDDAVAMDIDELDIDDVEVSEDDDSVTSLLIN